MSKSQLNTSKINRPAKNLAKSYRQRGVALILAIMITALAAAMAATLVLRVQQWIDRVALIQDYSQARELARSGFDYALAILQDDYINNSVDHLGEDWARKLPPFAGEGGVISGSIEDMQGKFNLNNLLVRGKINEKSLKMYKRLLKYLELNENLGETLADWLDSDDTSRENGAEESYYANLQPKIYIANSPLVSMDSLAQIKGYTPEVIKKLEKYIVVFPADNSNLLTNDNKATGGTSDPTQVDREKLLDEEAIAVQPRVNVNTAEAEVIAAAIDGLTVAEARDIVRYRKSAHFRDITDFYNRLPSTKELKFEISLETRTFYFYVRSAAKYGEAQVSMKGMVYRSAKQAQRGWSTIVTLNME